MLPKTFLLSNKKKINLRIAQAKDASDLLFLKRSYIEESQTIPMTLQEYGNDAIKEAQLIEQYNHSDNSFLMIAEHEGKLIGNIDITGHHRISMQHTAVLGMGLNKGYRGLGVGSALIVAALDYIKSSTSIEIVWLEVFASNKPAIGLYLKYGFKECGYLPRFFKLNGDYLDKMTMSLSI